MCICKLLHQSLYGFGVAWLQQRLKYTILTPSFKIKQQMLILAFNKIQFLLPQISLFFWFYSTVHLAMHNRVDTLKFMCHILIRAPLSTDNLWPIFWLVGQSKKCIQMLVIIIQKQWKKERILTEHQNLEWWEIDCIQNSISRICAKKMGSTSEQNSKYWTKTYREEKY